jgi:hypothetical protein
MARKLGKINAARLVAAGAFAALCGTSEAGTWARLAHDAPGNANQMMLLSDGTVMVSRNYDIASTIPGRDWWKLTPDSHGSYQNGTWSSLASMIDTRLYYSSQVLKDGRVWVAGGEYGTGGPKSELYDPVANTWTALPIPAAIWSPASNNFYDSCSEILEDGRCMISPVFPHSAGIPLIYDPATNSWANGPRLFRGSNQSEATWVKLPDDSILTVDPYGTFSERYIPSTSSWVNDGVVPISLYDPFGFELGGAVLLPNGKAFWLGSTGHTALYTPSGTSAPGVWAAGPDIPGAHGTPDAPCAVMANGKVLCSVSPIPTSGNHFPSPTTFYEYDWVTNSFAPMPTPTGGTENIPCYVTQLLVLPDGNLLFTHMGPDVYIYRPGGAPLAAGKPVINGVTHNGDGSFHLTGTGLNGISQGASYGDDFQMSTNYPLVRLAEADGTVRYGRTFNWSSTGVMTGSRVVSTEYRLPAQMPAGEYRMVVVTNGIESDPFCADAPDVRTNPAAQAACGTGAGEFAGAGAGAGPFAYRWQREASPGVFVDLADGTTGAWDGGGDRVGAVVSGSGTPALRIEADAVNRRRLGPTHAVRFRLVISNACGSTASEAAQLSVCVADFNCDGQADFFDYLDFAVAFDLEDAGADFNADGQVDFFDYLDFAAAFSAGC